MKRKACIKESMRTALCVCVVCDSVAKPALKHLESFASGFQTGNDIFMHSNVFLNSKSEVVGFGLAVQGSVSGTMIDRSSQCHVTRST